MGQGPVVVKIGGSTLGSHDTTLEDLVAFQRQGSTPVVVHGGGPQISRWMERQGNVPRFVRGLRVTDAASLEVVTAVLAGLINKQMVAAFLALGAKVIGLSGADGEIIQARITDPELGLVGEVVAVNTEPILELLRGGYLPLIAPLAVHVDDGSPRARSLLNVNGDAAAGHLARALDGEALVFLTDVEGVLDSSGKLISRLSVEQARAALSSGMARGGMIPKLEACILALERVSAAYVVDGRIPGALPAALGQGRGTRIG